MGEFLTAKHSFNAGDSITILPGFQKIYKETGKKVVLHQRIDLPADYSHSNNHPIKSDEGVQVCMNKRMFDFLKPLIEAQAYVERFEVWGGQKVDFDFDLTRQNSRMPLPGGSIHHWASLIFPQLECDLSVPWVKTPHRYAAYKTSTGDYSYIHENIIINRTERYNNPYISYSFLKEYEAKLLFVGTDREHAIFCDSHKLNIKRLFVDDALILAQAINDCLFYIGNQSMAWHICDSIKKKRIVEICAEYPNTFPTGADGHSFITQQALEYQFNKLFK